MRLGGEVRVVLCAGVHQGAVGERRIFHRHALTVAQQGRLGRPAVARELPQLGADAVRRHRTGQIVKQIAAQLLEHLGRKLVAAQLRSEPSELLARRHRIWEGRHGSVIRVVVESVFAAPGA